MKIDYKLSCKDKNNNLSESTDSISYLEFVKELSFVGINSKSNVLQTICRILSIAFDFAPSFVAENFHLHPDLESDPTEKAQFSNKVGRAFAVYLSKRIYKAKYVYSYECAMENAGLKVKGKRPDYYCNNQKVSFSVEAKGLSDGSVSCNEMSKHKNQALSGPLPKAFSVASVAYNIYDSPKINFFDPESDEVSYDRNLSELLRKNYYAGILKLVESHYFNRSESLDNRFYEYSTYLWPENFMIVLHKSIVEKRDFTEKIDSFKNDIMFIDTDGLGLRIDLDDVNRRIENNK